MDELQAVTQRLQQGKIPVQRMRIHHDELFAITVGELMAVCAKNPDHPKAQIYIERLNHLPADFEVNINRVDLTAVIENKDVKTTVNLEASFVNGRQEVIKTEYKELKD